MDLDFGMLFDDQYDPVAAYLARRQVDRATAEDIAAATFLEAYDRRATYDPGRGEPRAWLFGIAINLLRHHFRSEHRRLQAYARAASREVAAPDEGDRACGRLDADATASVIAGALAAMPRGDYDVLTLTCWAELSEREVATALGIPTGTVKSRLNRARRQLRAQLELNGIENSDG